MNHKPLTVSTSTVFPRQWPTSVIPSHSEERLVGIHMFVTDYCVYPEFSTLFVKNLSVLLASLSDKITSQPQERSAHGWPTYYQQSSRYKQTDMEKCIKSPGLLYA